MGCLWLAAPLPLLLTMPRSIILFAVVAAVAAGAFVIGRWTAPPPATPTTQATLADLPPVPPISTDTRRPDIAESPDIDAVIRDVNQVAGRGYWQMNKKWEIAINGLGGAAMRRLLGVLDSHPQSAAKMQLSHAFYSRWAENEPAAALAHAQAAPPAGTETWRFAVSCMDGPTRMSKRCANGRLRCRRVNSAIKPMRRCHPT